MINEPKYDIENGKIVNAATKKPIPDDEPIMIFRAKDRHAIAAISNYLDLIHDPTHQSAVHSRLLEFSDFATNHPERVKEPDTEDTQDE